MEGGEDDSNPFSDPGYNASRRTWTIRLKRVPISKSAREPAVDFDSFGSSLGSGNPWVGDQWIHVGGSADRNVGNRVSSNETGVFVEDSSVNVPIIGNRVGTKIIDL